MSVPPRPWCTPPWRPGAPAAFGVLAALLDDVRFRPGWSFHLMTYGRETMLAVELECTDSMTGEAVLVGHRFWVPPALPAPHDGRAFWRRWLLERIGDVDRHEACEWFQERVPADVELDAEHVLVDSCEWVRPFDPHHDPMQHAYRVVDWTAAP